MARRTRRDRTPVRRSRFLDIGVLVFREGLECILVLAAITASMDRKRTGLSASRCDRHRHRFCRDINHMVYRGRIVGQLTESIPALDLQAATGLLAVIVLLVIMNWFFHKIYWGGWIWAHNRRRKALLANSAAELGEALFFKLRINPTWIYFPLSREASKLCFFFRATILRLGGERRAKRRAARPSSLRDGRCPHLRSSSSVFNVGKC